MTDIDEIALETVKAIGNIDPDKLPGGKTQAIAQAQILVRDAIEKQIEQAEMKVDLFRRACEDLLDERSLERALILRKQAESVDGVVKRIREAISEVDRATPEESDTACTLRIAEAIAISEAQRLCRQADEAERAGGEK